MALDRLWTLYASISDSQAARGGVTVWLQFEPQSSLVSLPSQVLGALQPIQTVTVRMRWRADVTLASVLIDDRDKVWRVQQTLEAGRRRWLDVTVTSFEEPAVVVTTWPPQSDGGAPQAGYTLGARSLFVSSVPAPTRDTTDAGLPYLDWSGVVVTNAGGLAGAVPGRLILGHRSGAYFDAYFNDSASSLATSSYAVSAEDATIPAVGSVRVWQWTSYASQSPALAVGDELFVLTSTEVAALPEGTV